MEDGGKRGGKRCTATNRSRRDASMPCIIKSEVIDRHSNIHARGYLLLLLLSHADVVKQLH